MGLLGNTNYKSYSWRFYDKTRIALAVLAFVSAANMSHAQTLDLDKKLSALIDRYVYGNPNFLQTDSFMLKHALAYEYTLSKVDSFFWPETNIIQAIRVESKSGELKVIEFYEFGEFKNIFNWDMYGSLKGCSIFYAKSGSVSAYSFGDINCEIQISYYPNRSIECVTRLIKNAPNGYRYCYYESGQLMAVAKYNNDHSYHLIRYSENGRRLLEADIDSREQYHGLVIYYNKRGRVKKTEMFQHGEKLK